MSAPWSKCEARGTNEQAGGGCVVEEVVMMMMMDTFIWLFAARRKTVRGSRRHHGLAPGSVRPNALGPLRRLLNRLDT